MKLTGEQLRALLVNLNDFSPRLLKRFLRALVIIVICSGSAIAAPRKVSTPNDCTIVAIEKARAIEAAARLHKVNVWARVLGVYFEGQNMGHSYCVYQPGRFIYAYDADGSMRLDTTSRDPNVIGRAIGARTWSNIRSARFLE